MSSKLNAISSCNNWEISYIDVEMNNNYITYATATEFYEGIYELNMRGMKFIGHYDELKIELLGGY